MDAVPAVESDAPPRLPASFRPLASQGERVEVHGRTMLDRRVGPGPWRPRNTVQQAVSTSMLQMSKKLESSFKKLSAQNSDISETVKGKKRTFSKAQAKSSADDSPQAAGPSPRKELNTVETDPSPLKVTQLRDTDDDMDYNDGEYDDIQDPDDLWQGPLEKRQKMFPFDSSSSRVYDYTVLDALGEPMFDPTLIHHPNSTEWFPSDHVAEYDKRGRTRREKCVGVAGLLKIKDSNEERGRKAQSNEIISYKNKYEHS
ncbi:hypothetical protein NDU88_003332 [Pleurodeles waltl]|uniref:Uncharacterized protein n=1 Tax=Pleurodeles waltl TaxID=8319 RepID=A0AAV7UDZ5_PLEWA|nr:hypothetical protein NDU88_003332 [Pleurodeles waltl]